MIACNVCIHIGSQGGLTALMLAVKEGYSDIVAVLLKVGANTNIPDKVSAPFS